MLRGFAISIIFFFNDTATTEIYTLSLHDALPIYQQKAIQDGWWVVKKYNCMGCHNVQVGQKSVLSGLPQYQEGGTLGAIQLGREQLPPGLMTEGARVDPNWLLRFLCDPSLSNGSEQCRSLGSQPVASAQGGGPSENGNGRGSASNTQSGPGGGTPNVTSTAGQIANGGVQGALPAQPGENRNGVRTHLPLRMPTFTFSPNQRCTTVRFFLRGSATLDTDILLLLVPLT